MHIKKAYSQDEVLSILRQTYDSFHFIGVTDIIEENGDIHVDEDVTFYKGNIHCVDGLLSRARRVVKDEIDNQDFAEYGAFQGSDEDDEDGDE